MSQALTFIMCCRCLENVYKLRYQQTLATLEHTQQTASSLDIDMTEITTTDTDTEPNDDDDDASMNCD